MSAKRVYEVFVALSHENLSYCVEESLRKMVHIKVTPLRANDQYQILDLIKSNPPDLVLASPTVLSDPLLPLLKDAANLSYTMFVAYCTTLEQMEYNRNYDARILFTDSEEELFAIIENTLAMDVNKEEEQLLTPREKEVVIQVVRGLTNKEIADELCLSTHTIITHRRNIARKLDIHSPSGLTIYAIMNNLVKLEDIMK